MIKGLKPLEFIKKKKNFVKIQKPGEVFQDTKGILKWKDGNINEF